VGHQNGAVGSSVNTQALNGAMFSCGDRQGTLTRRRDHYPPSRHNIALFNRGDVGHENGAVGSRVNTSRRF